MSLLCLKHFLSPPFKVSSNATSCRKPFLIHLEEIHLLPVSLCSACNCRNIKFYLVLTATVPVVWVFAEIQDQSCPSLYLSLGVVPWIREALSKHSRN